jgi:class 3 adenylate cyclase
MVCSGLPNRNGANHCAEACRLALALLVNSQLIPIPKTENEHEPLKIRLGINSGPVTTGKNHVIENFFKKF